MNKLTIPAILVATVMVAGAFAFMPVQQASTVHTTIQGTQQNLVALELTDPDNNVGDLYTIACTTDYVVLGIVALMTGTVTDNDLTVSAGGEDVSGAIVFAAGVPQELIGTAIAALAADDVVLTSGAETDNANEVTVVKAGVLTSNDGTCTLT